MPAVLVTGANRGLGLEFVRQYATEGWQVVAVCRDPSTANELVELAAQTGSLEILGADVTDRGSVREMSASLGGRPIDLLINNAGVFGPSQGADDDPGQVFGSLDYEQWAHVFAVNTLGPVAVAETLFANVQAAAAGKIVTVSSRLGSIDQTEAGYYAYRTSKAAVNMAMATLAAEPAARGIIVCVLHPGWVRTDMGGEKAPVGVDESVAGMREQIAVLTPADSGRFIDYQGKRMPW